MTPDKTRPTWEDVWMQTAIAISKRSKCSRAQIGAVIVDSRQNVLSCSYNGPPPSWRTPADSCRDWCPRAQSEVGPGMSYDSCPANHAEANAIARADSQRLAGATCFITGSICMTCAKLLAAAGVTRVVHKVSPSDSHRDPERVEAFLQTCGVEVVRV